MYSVQYKIDSGVDCMADMTDRQLEKVKQRGKERLLQAATQLAQQQPFDEVTIDEIVKTAELSRPAFYYHFAGGKEELRLELVRRGVLSDVPVTDTKQAVIDAALRVFARSGVAGATLEDIATEAGVSRGALNWHFHSKDELLTAIIEHPIAHIPLRQAIEEVDRDLQNGVPLTDEAILRRLAAGFYDSFTTQSDMIRLPILLLHSHPDVAHLLANRIVRSRRGIVEYIKKRQEDGAFCKNIDAAFFVQTFGASFIMRALGQGLTDLLPFGHASREETIEQLVSLFLYGMVKRPQAENENQQV